MHASPEPQWWSWADIVRHADRLGIPNFQRGAVWDAANRVALLESIYEQAPCGTFVLWAPDGDEGDPHRHGVPLRRFGSCAAPMWLVDGQQRTRTMLDTFQQLIDVPRRSDAWSLVRESDLAALRDAGSWLLGDATEEEGAAEADAGADGEDEPHLWMVVLPAMAVFERDRASFFGRHSESRSVRRGSMFRRLRLRARVRSSTEGTTRPVPPLPVGMVPLAALLAPESVFHHAEARQAAQNALDAFLAGTPDVALLDALLPWGPQFATGHALGRAATETTLATPMRWMDLHARRTEADLTFMVACLRGLFSPEWAPVFERFRGMLTGNRFAVGWLPPSNVSSAIDAYVRINRAGIRVRPEERALALLSRARPQLLDDLAAFTRRRDGGGPIDDQRALLAHESERQLGFPVWMTTVTRYATLALLGDFAPHWLGVSAIDKATFSYRLDRVGPNESEAASRTWARPDYGCPGDLIAECAERATASLLLLDAVLSKELWWDHRMARPSVRALDPLIDLFYRVPAAELERLADDEGFRAALARLLHWTLLAPYIDHADMQQLIVEIHGIDQERARKTTGPLPCWNASGPALDALLREAFQRYQSSLLTLWHGRHVTSTSRRGQAPVDIHDLDPYDALNRLGVHAFRSEVRDARSLQHPAVGWLYAIERRAGAREFSWAAQTEGFRRSNGKIGVPVEGATGRTRTTRHDRRALLHVAYGANREVGRRVELERGAA